MNIFKIFSVFSVSVLLLSGNYKEQSEEDKIDLYLLAKAKELNKSNQCDVIQDALKIQQARISLINRIPEFNRKPAFNDLTRAIEYNLDKLECIQKAQPEFCSWNFAITGKTDYKKIDIPMNIYLIAMLTDKQKKQLKNDLPVDLRLKLDQFEVNNSTNITLMKKYFDDR